MHGCLCVSAGTSEALCTLCKGALVHTNLSQSLPSLFVRVSLARTLNHISFAIIGHSIFSKVFNIWEVFLSTIIQSYMYAVSFILMSFGFYTAPGVFASCPDPTSDDAVCIDTPREEEVAGDFIFDTAAIFHLNMSGPCNLNQTAYAAKLSRLDSGGGSIFDCTYDRGSTNIQCQDMGRVRVKFNTDEHDGSNAFNFGLQLTNLQLDDSGLYEYQAMFTEIRLPLRTITKRFNLTVVESRGEFNAITLCIPKCKVIHGG